MKHLFLGLGILHAVCVMVLILFIGVQVSAFGMWFYSWQYDANDTYATVDMQPDDLHTVTRHLIRYMQGREADLQITTRVGGETRPFFSDIEIRHMIDVHDLFVVGFRVQWVVVFLFLASSAAFYFKGRKYVRGLFRAWQFGAAAVLTFFVTLVLFIAVDWHRAFDIFHEIFFDNEYWRLDPREDLLINIVPYPFFITLSIFIGVFFVVGLIFLCAAGTFLSRYTVDRKQD